ISLEGKVVFATQAVAELLGYSAAELIGLRILDYVTSADTDQFSRELQRAASAATSAAAAASAVSALKSPLLPASSGSDDISIVCRLRSKTGSEVLVSVSGNPFYGSLITPMTLDRKNIYIRPVGSNYHRFLLTVRPYPTEKSSYTFSMDSFLDHQIENLRIKQKFDRSRHSLPEPPAITNPEVIAAANVAERNIKTESSGVDFGVQPSELHSLSTHRRHSTGEVLSNSSRLHTSPGRVKHGSTSSVSEYLTSPPGRQRHAPTTSDPNGRVTKVCEYDLRRRSRSRVDRTELTLKSQKLKVLEEREYKCSECGTIDSPEWRKGPVGPKTLCNACGLRWSKSLKKSRLAGNK
ncbi:uncharacterized protein V1516DRAFT_627779, partial [Lipomyces oligophaga]|uniref:uncharacterized protein n=1 Tax=Lipomyces oligophaga TaxID=45792 RepID=UPI0034CFAAA7